GPKSRLVACDARTSAKAFTRHVVDLPRVVRHAPFAGRNEVEPQGGIVGRRHEVRATSRSGANHCTLFARLRVRSDARPPRTVDRARPGGFHERFPKDELARDAIEDVEEPVTVCVQKHFSWLASNREIREDRYVRRIVVPRIVRRELIVPAQSAGISIESHDGRCVEVVAFPIVAVHLWARVAGSPIDRAQLRTVAAAPPCRTAAGLPAVTLGPALTARLSRTGNRVKAPGTLSRLRVVRVDEPTHPVLAATHPDNDFVLDDERR